MPVLGHAIVGLATAMSIRPSNKAPVNSAMWAPLIVSLAYLPDIITQILLLAGLHAWIPASHSMLLAPAAALIIAIGLDRIRWLTFWRALVLTLFCILLHDVLDLLQGSNRMPLWPIFNRPTGFALGDKVSGIAGESIFFGGFFVIFLACRWVLRKLRIWEAPPVLFPSGNNSSLVWTGRVLTALILVCAAGTHYLRGIREQQLKHAWTLLMEKQYSAALALFDEVERWPSTAKPGRIDYARAEAYLGLGDRTLAEQYYRRAYEEDPSYFWVVADLAVFYASSDESAEVRRQRTAPYLNQLQNEFADHQNFPNVISRIHRKLNKPASASIPALAD